MYFTQDDNTKAYMLIVEGKKGNLAIPVESIENFIDDMKGRLTIIYSSLEKDESVFSKSKGQMVAVRREESFETTENEMLIKTYAAVRAKMITNGAQKQM